MIEVNKSLEYEKIEKMLEEYFSFEDSLEDFKKEEMIKDDFYLDREHKYLSELLDFFNQNNIINTLHVYPLRNYFSLLDKGGNIGIKGLADFLPFLENISLYIEAFKDRNNMELILDLVLDLRDFKYIHDRIDQAILPDLTIDSNASSTLYSIRKKIQAYETSISSKAREIAKKYSNYLAESNITIKDGLPSLAVKNSYKSYVKGFVSDVSNSGSTVYIVPLEIIEMNNEIYELKEKEKEEEERIVKALTQLIKEEQEAIEKDYLIALRLDSLLARVKFGLSYKGSVASISTSIKLEELSHLLINRDVVVKNDFEVEDDKKIVVITGPNAGGKTVLIKAISLACYLNQRGYLVPAKKAELKTFSSIEFIAGDGQSIMDNLSTFSGHIVEINSSLSKIDEDSLFVVDEIGQGTSPLDGEAIGNAVIDYLENVGCYGILTSHYEGLKEKAIRDDEVEVGAMIFDEDTIKPTFKYKRGLIGRSYALEVAKNLHMKEEILVKAQEYLDRSLDSEEKKAIANLTKLQEQNERLKQSYEEKLNKLNELNAKREQAIKALQVEKENIKAKAQDKIDSLVDEKIDELDEIFKKNKNRIDLASFASLKGQLNKMKEREEDEVKVKVRFEVNDYVKVNSINNTGYIKSIKGNKIEVDIDGMLLKTDLGDLVKLPDPKKAKIKQNYAKIDKVFLGKSGVPLECNLIGLHVDEAKEKLEKYIDDCMLMHYHEVRIIHGHGTGALRTMVKEYCASNKNIKSTRFGDTYEGGVGATIITFK
ncbi:MAG: Smr/MutS family protein [Bacilli bacterium]|nr:Smr/MutS family protein [Bacilli bacterium]